MSGKASSKSRPFTWAWRLRKWSGAGIVTERGNQNHKIKSDNQLLRELKARINKLKNWLDGETRNADPNLQDAIFEILNGRADKTRWQRTADLKTAAKVLLFLQTNGVTDMPQLREKVTQIREQFYDMSDKLKSGTAA